MSRQLNASSNQDSFSTIVPHMQTLRISDDGNEQTDDMPFAWSPPKHHIPPPVQRSPRAFQFLNSPARSGSKGVSPARAGTSTNGRAPENGEFELKHALYTMLKSERDPTATDHHEAKLQADALRASVTRLGDSIVHGRALILEEQPREPGSPEREDQIIVYMQRLQDTREKLTRLVDGTLESRDALEHAMGELDAALAGVKYRIREMTPLDYQIFFAEGPLFCSDQGEFYFQPMQGRATSSSIDVDVARLQVILGKVLDQVHLTQLTDAVERETTALIEVLDRAKDAIKVALMRCDTIRKAMNERIIIYNPPAKRPAVIQLIFVENVLRGLVQHMGELESNTIVYRDLLSCIRPLREGTGRAMTTRHVSQGGTSGSVSRSEDAAMDDSPRTKAMKGFVHDLRVKLEALVAHQSRRDGGRRPSEAYQSSFLTPSSALLSPASPIAPPANSVANDYSFDRGDGTFIIPIVDLSKRSLRDANMSQRDLLVLQKTAEAFNEAESNLPAETDSSAIDDAQLDEVEEATMQLFAKITRVLRGFHRGEVIRAEIRSPEVQRNTNTRPSPSGGKRTGTAQTPITSPSRKGLATRLAPDEKSTAELLMQIKSGELSTPPRPAGGSLWCVLTDTLL